MKKKIIALLFIFIIIVTSFKISNATTIGKVYIESNTNMVQKGEEIEITINIENVKTAAYNYSLHFDELKFDYISNIENTNVKENRIISVWYDTKGGKEAKQGELAKFKFKAKEDGIATFIVQGEFYNEKGQQIETEFIEKQITIGEQESTFQIQSEEEKGDNKETTNANLQSLRLDIEGITPQFNEQNYEYYLTIPNDITDIDVLAISKNPNASVEISGNKGLKQGLNIITISVTSEDKTKRNEYKIQVTKTANLELANTNLETLAIENALLNPPFDNIETKYKIEVSNKIEKLNILAIPQNEKAKVQIIGGDNLKVGKNVVEITVTATNGITKRKYQIEVYKRNEEQENGYNQEQEDMQNKLEEAYEIEKLSSDTNENIDKQQKSNKNTNIVLWVSISTLILVLLIAVGVWYCKYKYIKRDIK